MARNTSAEKRNRQNEVRRERNRGYRSRMRSGIKKLRGLVESGDTEAARASLPQTLGLIERTAQKGVIHQNTADRYKSRLTKLVAGSGKAE
ncbi:MAG TPA: 30S ribosomal protein S20 [Thermoanaerobaculia bacterium]|nr:30S ribosomal protein S20 [Thermoanaerobaculia bacterium]